VHDNGAGLSPNQTHSADSFGHQLIQTLVARLGAQITYSSDNGTKVDVFSGIT
jgi:two-component sensor histidine kinase